MAKCRMNRTTFSIKCVCKTQFTMFIFYYCFTIFYTCHVSHMLRGILLFSISHVMRYETASLYATTACHLLYHCLSKML